MAGERWTAEETAYLQFLCGDLPFWMVARAMRRQAKKNGWPVRDISSYKNKAMKTGISINCSGQWVTLTHVAQTVHTDPRRLMQALQEEGLTPRTLKWIRWISRPMLRTLARRRPKVFAGLSEPELIQLLDSETMAAELAAMGMQRYRRFRPVVCVETGKRYASICEAGRSVYIGRATIAHAIKTNGTAAEMHWRYAD